MVSLYETDVETAALSWLSSLGWQTAYGPDIAPDTPNGERTDFTQVVLEERLRNAFLNLNSDLPPSALETGLRQLINPDGPTLEARNRAFHHALTRGVTVPIRRPDGTTSGEPANVVDFENPSNNDWLAVNQFTVKENQSTRRADIVLFLNGLPLGIIELKNPADENADVWEAWNQLQTYKAELPTLFSMNEFLIGLRRPPRPGRHPDRRGVVQALERPWRTAGNPALPTSIKPWKTMDDQEPGAPNLRFRLRCWATPGDAGRRLRAGQLPDHPEKLHRVRRRRERETRQEDGRVPPVPRRPGRRGRDPPGHRAPGDSFKDSNPARRSVGGPAHRSRLAQPGVREEPDHGLLRRRHHPGPGNEQPNHRGPHRPERPGRPTLRHLLSVQGPPQAEPGPGRQQGRPPAANSP